MKGSEIEAWTFSTPRERTCKFVRQPSRRNRSPSEAPGVSDLLDFWLGLPRLHCARGPFGSLYLANYQGPAATVKKKAAPSFATTGRP